MRITITTLEIGIVLLLVCMAPATAVAGQWQQTGTAAQVAQQANYSVTVSIPGEVTTGEETLAVTVDNTGSSDLINPIIETPLDGRLNATAADANTAVASVGGTNESINAEINSSTLTAGNALFMFGRQVPAGEQRTYYVNVNVTAAGATGLDTEVRPLYNEDINVTDSRTVQAKGYGNLTINVRQPEGTVAGSASVTVDGESHPNGQTREVVEGNYTISVEGVTGITPTLRNVSIDVEENKEVAFTAHDSVANPAVTATTAGASVIPPSVGTRATSGTATRNQQNKTQYTIQTGSGTSVLSESVPANLRPVKNVEVAPQSGQVVSKEQANGLLNYTLSTTGNTDATVTFTGYKLGDANLDDTVDGSDAGEVASELAARNATGVPQYGDVNDDGNVTVVDAMYIAQYANNQRTAEYQTGGGT